MNEFDNLENYPIVDWEMSEKPVVIESPEITAEHKVMKEIDIMMQSTDAGKVPDSAKKFMKFKIVKEEKRFDGINVSVLAEYLIRKHYIMTSDGVYYIYNEGIYIIDYENLINSKIQDELGSLATTKVKSDVRGYIFDNSRIKLDINESTGVDPSLIAFNNGIYNRKTKKFSEHSPDNFLLTKLRVNYDPKASTVDAKQMLINIFGDDFDNELEFLGYALTNTNWLDTISFYVGDGSNGRSFYFDWLKGFFGASNCCSIDPHTFGDDRFAGYGLLGKQACLSADIGSGTIKDFHLLKQYSTLDMVRLQDKGKTGFETQLCAKFFYGCNAYPHIADKSYGAIRRQRIVVLKRMFDKMDADFDPGIKTRAMTPKEYSGMVNLILPALERVTARKGFEKRKNSSDFARRVSRPIHAFVEDCLNITGLKSDKILIGDLGKMYTDWSEFFKLPIPHEESFIEQFANKYGAKGVIKKQTTLKSKRGTYMVGVTVEQLPKELAEIYGGE